MTVAAWIEARLTREEMAFAVLRALALIGGVVALLLVPTRPEHQAHVPVLVGTFIVYKAILFTAIFRWPGRAQRIFLWTLTLDLLFVFFLVWFTGGFESHFYLLFYLLVSLNAYYFGFRVGVTAAAAAGLLYAVAFVLTPPIGVHWTHVASRIVLFGLLGVSLGALSERERRAREEAEQLNRELQARQGELERAYRNLQEAQERLIQSERLATVGRMAAKVAHEIRNPLSSISLNAELLEDEVRSAEGLAAGEAPALLSAIRSQLDLLAAITEDYLRFARLPKPDPQPVAVGELLSEVTAFVGEEASARGVDLRVEAAAGLPAVLADWKLMTQVLLNLVRNAFEAMPRGGSVRISARKADARRGQLVDSSIGQLGKKEEQGHADDVTNRQVDHSTSGLAARLVTGPQSSVPHPAQPLATADRGLTTDGDLVEIAVTDTGQGIAPEDMGRIFEPFFTTKEDGTGLGLAIARQIVEEQGGHIACRSGPGVTVFTLTLPTAEGGAP